MERRERWRFANGLALLAAAALSGCSAPPPTGPRIAEGGNTPVAAGRRGSSSTGGDGGACQGSLETSGAPGACGGTAVPPVPGSPSYIPQPAGHFCTFDHECTPGNWCSRTTRTCEAVVAWGAPCTDDAECGVLACVDQGSGRRCGLNEAPCDTIEACHDAVQACESAAKRPCGASCTRGFCLVSP
jgi:hypothetical protein